MSDGIVINVADAVRLPVFVWTDIPGTELQVICYRQEPTGVIHLRAKPKEESKLWSVSGE